jgi:hypothetical protein
MFLNVLLPALSKLYWKQPCKPAWRIPSWVVSGMKCSGQLGTDHVFPRGGTKTPDPAHYHCRWFRHKTVAHVQKTVSQAVPGPGRRDEHAPGDLEAPGGSGRPDMLKTCKAAMENGSQDMHFIRVDKKTFLTCPEDSIDYAVMEKSRKHSPGTGRGSVRIVSGGG